MRRPLPRRTFACVLVIMSASPFVSDGIPFHHATKDSVRLLAEYIRWYDTQLPALVADEQYVQEIVVCEGGARSSRRVLEAEVAWVHLPELRDTLGVREVRRVDGAPVSPPRLAGLLAGRTANASATARAILDESASHNLMPGSRNLNFPTFPLVYARQAHSGRIRWRSARPEGDRLVLQFEERRRPTIVRDAEGRDMRATGRFWIDTATGRVERCAVRLAPERGDAVRAPAVHYSLEVTFAPEPRLSLWLPSSMNEEYRREDPSRAPGASEVVIGTADYRNYRRFETSGRLVPRP